MSEGLVHVEERRAAQRCAICHGALEAEPARCPSCHVECHRECRGQLGHCPTLGCAHHRSGHAPAPASAAAPPRELPSALVEALAADTRRAFRVSLALALAGIVLFGVVWSIHGVFKPTPLSRAARSKEAADTQLAGWMGSGIALGLCWGAAVIVFFKGALHLQRSARALGRLEQLAHEAPVDAVLHIRDPIGRFRPRLILHELGHFNSLRFVSLAPAWIYESPEQEVPVRVRRIVGKSPLLLESANGDLALVFPA